MKSCKICGINTPEILQFLNSHPTPPRMIGFICNFSKSKRFVKHDKLKDLLKIDKKNSKYVAVLVGPFRDDILEKIKHLPFDYYQIYDCTPEEIKLIKEKYKKKIITAFTVSDKSDIKNFHLYNDVTDIYLFDSKGYEASRSFDHSLIKDIKLDKEVMIAGNIKHDEDLKNYFKLADIVDISGGIESSGLKDISKINIFLNNVNKTNNET